MLSLVLSWIKGFMICRPQILYLLHGIKLYATPVEFERHGTRCSEGVGACSLEIVSLLGKVGVSGRLVNQHWDI